MSERVYDVFLGNVIRIDGVCYEYTRTTTDPAVTPPVEGIFSDCFDCQDPCVSIACPGNMYEPGFWAADTNEADASLSVEDMIDTWMTHEACGSTGAIECARDVSIAGEPGAWWAFGFVCYTCSSSVSSQDSSSSSDTQSSSSEQDDPPSVDCGEDPDVIVSVTGSPGDFPITWCGKTWVASGATGDQLNNGEEATICPTSYTLRQYTPTFTLSGRETWGASGLGMQRYFSAAATEGGAATAGVSLTGVYFPFGNVNSYQNWFGYNPPFTFTNTLFNSPPSVIAGSRPTNGDYRITDDLFGSATSGTVTYSWRRGSNW